MIWRDGDLAGLFDLKIGEDTSLDVINRALNLITEKGKYHIDVLCFNPEGKSTKSVSKSLEVKESIEGVEIYTIPGDVSTTSISFKYSGEWLWSIDEKNWMPVTTTTVQGGFFDGQQPIEVFKSLIKSLVGGSLEEGKSIFTNKKIIDGIEVYKVPGITVATSISFEYSNGWFWSVNKKEWMPVTTTTVQGGFFSGQQPIEAFKSLIKSLIGKSLEDGKRILS